MLFGELGAFAPMLNNSPLREDRIWQRPMAEVSETEIQFFYARAGLAGHREHAIDCIDRLQAVALAAVVEGTLSSEEATTVVLHELPEVRFLVDELIAGLAKLRPARRGAVLYALENHQDPAVTSVLTWAKAQHEGLQLSDLSKEILAMQARVRHLKLPYVFWEWATPDIATPLIELQLETERAFDMGWPLLQARYRGMIKVNRTADSTSFLQLANQAMRH